MNRNGKKEEDIRKPQRQSDVLIVVFFAFGIQWSLVQIRSRPWLPVIFIVLLPATGEPQPLPKHPDVLLHSKTIPLHPDLHVWPKSTLY